MRKFATIALSIPLSAGLMVAQSDRQQQTGQTGSSDTRSTDQTRSGSHTDRQGASSQSDRGTSTQGAQGGTQGQINRSGSQSSGASALTGNNWRGTLVDANCILPTGSAMSGQHHSSQSSSGYSSRSSTTADPASSSTSTADRRSTSTTSSSERDTTSTTRPSDRAASSNANRTSDADQASRTTTRESASASERRTTTSGEGGQSQQSQTTSSQSSSTQQRSAAGGTSTYDEQHSADRSAWSDSRNKTLDRKCGITDTTTSFAFVAPGGQLVYFDDASNARIAQELKSGNWTNTADTEFSSAASDNKRIYRVTVNGSMQNDRIRLDSISRR